MRKFLLCIFFSFLFVIGLAQTAVDSASLSRSIDQLKFDENTVAVIGEAHLMCSYSAEQVILEALTEKKYTNIFIEGGESEATIINMFMRTGDTSLLKYTRARESSGTYRAFLKHLYNLNKKRNNAFVFRGFDFERIPCVQFLFSEWFKNVSATDTSVRREIIQLLSLKEPEKKKGDPRLQGKEIKETFSAVKASFPQHEKIYKEMLGDKFILFKRIIFNPVYSEFGSRDVNMTSLLLAEEKEAGLHNAVIIVGNHHVIYKNTFIPALADSLPEKYSLVAFVLGYDKCADENKKYSSDKKILKHMDNNSAPHINFIRLPEQLVPASKKNVPVILAALHNL